MKTRTSHAVGRLALCASIGAMLCATPLPAEPLEDWETLYPLPSGRTYSYGGGKWIGLRGNPQIFGDGEITHSADGLSWSKSKIPTGFRPISAAYANGLWVAAGQEGIHGINMFSAILTSTDGIVWEKQNPNMNLWRLQNENPWLSHLAYGDGVWMAMGSTGRYMTSTDGVNWTLGAIAGASSVTSISYGNGRWLGLSSNSSGNTHVSTNGTDWTTHNHPRWLAGAAFGGGQWAAVAVGSDKNLIRTSTDGIEWVTQQMIEHLPYYAEPASYRIEYGDGRWLVAGTERTRFSEHGPWSAFTITSSDGLTWERTTIPTSPIIEQIKGFVSLHYGNGLWLLNGQRYYGGSELLSSTDAVNWTPRTEGSVASVDMVYGAERWTGVGWTEEASDFYPLAIATSLDGRTWTRSEVRSDVIDEGLLTAVAYGNGRWMAAGYQLYGLADAQFSAGLILTATNDSEWVPTLTNAAGRFDGVAYGNGLWVAIGFEVVNNTGATVLATSPDGLAWTRRTMPVSGYVFLEKISFANGRWIVLGSRWNGSQDVPTMLTSTDAINWSNVGGITAVPFWGGIHFANGMWIVLTYRTHPDGFRRPTTLRSTNGTDWTVRDLDVEFEGGSNAWFDSIIHVAGRWVIGGRVIRGQQTHSALWSSDDGEQWTEHLTGWSAGALFSDGKRLFRLAEWGGGIRASGRLTPALPPMLSLAREGPDFSLWLNGETGERYDIEQTLNLTPPGWAHLQSITLTNASQRILLNPPTGASGFWRARTP